MSEQSGSRIAEARRRAVDAKRKLAFGAAAAFVAIAGLAWASHPGSSVSGANGTLSGGGTFDRNGMSSDDDGFFEEDDDFGGFDSFGGIAPSGKVAPQAQTHVS